MKKYKIINLLCYLSLRTSQGVNARQICSSKSHKHNL